MSDYSGAQRNQGFLAEVIHFLNRNKKWYVIPMAVVLILFVLLITFGSTSAPPFVYSVF